MRAWMLPVVLLIGCYSENKFAEDWATANCTLYDDCDYLSYQSFSDFEECYDEEVVDLHPDSQSDCDYDAKLAKTCVENVNQMSCEDLYEGDFPTACSKACQRGQ